MTIRSAIEYMRKVRCACGLVVEHGKLIGVVTERDVMNKVIGKPEMLDRPVGDIMTPNPVTLHPEDSVDSAIETMSRGGYRNLPVVDDDGKPIASVNVHAILQFIIEHFPQDVNNLPPRPDQQMATPEGG
jgi:CBS domain-containing protein